MPIKTSRDISEPLDNAMKRQNIQQTYMADDLGVSKQNVSNARHGFDTTPEKAMWFSQYLGDSKFNQQMAAVYFDAVSMFDANQWAEKFRDSPYATWVQLRAVEKHRMGIGEDVFEFGVKDRSEWTDAEHKMAYEWMIGLLKTISLASLMATQFSDMAHYDLDNFIKKFNRIWGA